MSRHAPQGYPLGLLLAFGGSLTLSFGGVVARQIEDASSWQIIFYRSIGLFIGLGALFLVRNRRAILRVLSASMRKAMLAGPFQGCASIFFILALTHTTIANAMLLMCATPLLAAALGWMLLREHLRISTVVAMTGAIAGISLMTLDGVSSGNTLGSIFALANALVFSLYLVLLRRGSRTEGVDMLPAVMVGATFAFAVSGTAAESLHVTTHDGVVCFLWGALLQTTGVGLLTVSARSVPAAELSLITLIESVGGPLWGWLIIGEVPHLQSILGGAVMVGVILSWSSARVLDERRRRILLGPAAPPTA